ncbi:MAG: hypothetical protein IJ880_07250 [Bacilli bacterium]|nr:hypothetical protein [Bacilli bacterium]
MVVTNLNISEKLNTVVVLILIANSNSIKTNVIKYILFLLLELPFNTTYLYISIHVNIIIGANILFIIEYGVNEYEFFKNPTNNPKPYDIVKNNSICTIVIAYMFFFNGVILSFLNPKK